MITIEESIKGKAKRLREAIVQAKKAGVLIQHENTPTFRDVDPPPFNNFSQTTHPPWGKA